MLEDSPAVFSRPSPPFSARLNCAAGILLKVHVGQCSNGGSMAEGRKAARGSDGLRFFGGFNARGNDPQHAAVQQSADDAVLAARVCAQRARAEVQGGAQISAAVSMGMVLCSRSTQIAWCPELRAMRAMSGRP